MVFLPPAKKKSLSAVNQTTANIEYADGSWVSIFEYAQGRSASNGADSLTGLEEAIQTRWDEGFDLVGVEYAEETWFGVFQEKISSSSAYWISSDRREFNESLAEFTAAGYDLIDFERIDDQWIGVYEQQNPGLAELGETVDAIGKASSVFIKYGWVNSFF
ncbi:MAG: hypothetical protein AAF652_16620 [Cyanobacteria bacterium P01_C01_bin.72]